MAAFSLPNLTTAVVGFASTAPGVASTAAYTVETSNGTVNVANLNIGIGTAAPGWLTGRRPLLGQLYPRGVYNK
jgi:hypothetical protein